MSTSARSDLLGASKPKTKIKWGTDHGGYGYGSGEGAIITNKLIDEYAYYRDGGGNSYSYHEDVFDFDKYKHMSQHLKDNIERAKTIITELWLKEDYKGYISLNGCQIRKKFVNELRDGITNLIKESINNNYRELNF